MMLSIVTVPSDGLPKVTATPAAPTAMPIEPQMSSGLRPNFSTVNTATSVNEIFTTPIITVCTIGFSIPMSWKMRGA